MNNIQSPDPIHLMSIDHTGSPSSSSSLYSPHQWHTKDTMPGAFPEAPPCLEESRAFKINGFETINDKVLREMNERAKNITNSSSVVQSPRRLDSFTSVKYSPPVSRSLASTAAAAARSPNRSPKRGHHKRYSSVHRRAFAKMESIASHYAARARIPADQGDIKLPSITTTTTTRTAPTERRVNETELHCDTKKDDYSDKRTSSRVVTNASKRRRMDALGRKVELRSSTSRQNLARLAAQQEAKRMADSAQNHNSPAFTSTQMPTRAPLSPIAQRTVSQPSPRRVGSGATNNNTLNASSSSRIPSLSFSAASSGHATTPRSPSTKSISAISVSSSQISKPSLMPAAASPSLSKIPVTTYQTASSVLNGLRREPLSPAKRVETMLNQLPPPPRSREALSKARLEARMAALKTCSVEEEEDEETLKSAAPRGKKQTLQTKASAPSLKSRLSGSASRLFKKSPSLANLKETPGASDSAKPKATAPMSRLPRSQGFAAPTQSSIGRLMRSQAAAKSSPNLKTLI